MRRFLAIVMLGSLASFAQAAKPQADQPSKLDSAFAKDNPSGGLPALPPVPEGKSTILGGKIRQVDPVRDQFLLDIYGQRPMKILFDERTQLFRDGVRIPVSSLDSEDRASVETILDGTNVFAISIHTLSHSAEGDCRGRVVAYDPESNVMSIASELSPGPVRLLVESNTSIARTGEQEFTATRSGTSDLVPGALVDATFETDAKGRDVARKIMVLAVPGASFTFSGTISFLDLNTGILNLVDPRDQMSYVIHFNPGSFAASQKLHPGKSVTVAASYDGTKYTASNITLN
jgi:hypothetical protein